MSRKAEDTVVKKLARDVIALQRGAVERRDAQMGVEGKVASLEVLISGVACVAAVAPDAADTRDGHACTCALPRSLMQPTMHAFNTHARSNVHGAR